MAELWDVYDENRRLVGKTVERGKQLQSGEYHIVVHVWITDGNGRFLISQRDASRPTFPLMWECVGGSVLKGETSFEGALREVKEEVGIDLNGADGKLAFSKVRKTIDGKKFNDILDVYLFTYNSEVSLKNATTNEVADVKWLTVDEIKDLYENGLLVDSIKYFFDKIAIL